MMDKPNDEAPVTTTSQADEKCHPTDDHGQHKKRSFLEDDFFSLTSSFEKKKKRHKHKSKDANSSSPGVPESAVKIEDPTISKQEPKSSNTDAIEGPKSDIVSTSNADVKPATSITKSLTTPPALDKEQILREIEKRVNEREAKMAPPLLDDSDEEEVQLQFVKSFPKTKTSGKSSILDNSYKFAESEEKKRRYAITVTSKLPAPEGQTIQVDLGCKGMKSFSKILKSSVDFYKTTFSSQLPPILLERYNTELCTLVWVEGKILLHSFYTPRTLRIPPPGGVFNALVDKIELMPPTRLHLFLIPKDNSENFMNVYPELRASGIEPETKEVEESVAAEEAAPSSSEDEEEEEEDDDDDDALNPSSRPDNMIDLANDDEGVFSIGLKGKDNKRVACKVTPETKIESLLKFYLKKKEIEESTVNFASVKMIFDDEELNLNDVVANTELEDDFEIQIIL
ncbi:ESC2 [Candida margitis]|uniref:ESC2 n=1 Tax=Candida margitis TaxID=1775924 RepID=UPI002227AEA0|nr:ESC2 [Candida margitis]KAI5968790.1 ESC2 [Candida margitis]